MDYDLIVVKTLERVYKNYYYIIRGETALVVSHATAICAYLLSYCEIEVKDAANKARKISFHGKEILNGRFQPADGFEILFENDIFSDIRVMGREK